MDEIIISVPQGYSNERINHITPQQWVIILNYACEITSLNAPPMVTPANDPGTSARCCNNASVISDLSHNTGARSIVKPKKAVLKGTVKEKSSNESSKMFSKTLAIKSINEKNISYSI